MLWRARPRYITSSALTVPVAGANVTGKSFALTPLPRISGMVKDSAGAGIAYATITVNTSADGGTTLTPYSTVTTAADGTYSAPVERNMTYYLVASKFRYSTSAVRTVAVVARRMSLARTSR